MYSGLFIFFLGYYWEMSGSHKLVIKDALWQLFGRVLSALFGFVITKIISSYLGPLRYGDYGTILRYFAWWTALVDFGVYVIALKQLGLIKNKDKSLSENPENANLQPAIKSELQSEYSKFLGMRVFMIMIIYTLAIVVAYLIPAYTDNLFIIWGLPLGMLYSASNMFVGVQQLPLQLFWKMKRLSRSLIVARFSQLAVLLPVVYLLFKNIEFSAAEPTKIAILAFVLVFFSVVASSIGQNIEINLRTRDLLKLKININFSFIKKILQGNWKYGFSYFFSSFHTLIVLMFLGWFFPTAEGFVFAGIWALALSLVEILLIIPSSLGNSLLHKIPAYSIEEKRKSFGSLLTIVIWIGALIALNFWIFADAIIPIVSSKAFLGSRANTELRGSNQVLVFLGIVLLLSFIKQVYNYLFVAIEKQNVLFWNNLIGVVIGVAVGVPLVARYALLGGVITQIMIELLFTFGAIGIAAHYRSSPLFSKTTLVQLPLILIFSLFLALLFYHYPLALNIHFFWNFLIQAVVFNIIVLSLSLPLLKKSAKGLTFD